MDFFSAFLFPFRDTASLSSRMPAPDSGVSFAFSVQEFQEAVPLT